MTVPVQVDEVVATVYKVSVLVGVGAVMDTTGAVASPSNTVRTGGVLVEVIVEPTTKRKVIRFKVIKAISNVQRTREK